MAEPTQAPEDHDDKQALEEPRLYDSDRIDLKTVEACEQALQVIQNDLAAARARANATARAKSLFSSPASQFSPAAFEAIAADKAEIEVLEGLARKAVFIEARRLHLRHVAEASAPPS